MFSALVVLLLSTFLLSWTAPVFSKPLTVRRGPSIAYARDNTSQTRNVTSSSFDNYHNISALNGFDQFFGPNNFDGRKNDQKIVIQEKQTQCEVVRVEIIQQKLAIIQELVKRIITEQICDVETQTIVLEQHNGVLKVLRDQIQRTVVKKQIGYDKSIAAKLSQIVNSDGTLNSNDLGFNGTDVGKNTVVPAGNNWNDATSPALVKAALQAAIAATKSNGTAAATNTTGTH